MGAATTTTFAPALKTLWPQSRYNAAVYKDNPFLAMVPKKTKFTGKNLVLAVRYADQQGRSASFSKAQTNRTGTAGAAFTLTRAKDYAIGSIDSETVLASEDDPGALASALDTESSSLLNQITRSLAIKCFGDGSGAIGKIAAGGIAGNVVTLATLEDITNFEVGQTHQANPTKTGTAGNMRAGNMIVTAVDRDAGTVTYGGGIVAALAAADYIYVDGDYDAALKGMGAWFPATAPAGGDNFFGQDRSLDATRLAGLRIDISDVSPEEGLVKALYRMGRESASPDYAFYNHGDFVNVQNSLGSKVNYLDLKVGEIGFQAIRVNGPRGTCKLLADMNAPKSVAYTGEMQWAGLYSLGKAPRLLNIDGNEILRVYNADENELRWAYYAQLGFEMPGTWARLALPV